MPTQEFLDTGTVCQSINVKTHLNLSECWRRRPWASTLPPTPPRGGTAPVSEREILDSSCDPNSYPKWVYHSPSKAYDPSLEVDIGLVRA